MNKNLTILLAILFIPSFILSGTSNLWGTAGEKWNKTRLPDYSYAGYQAGEKAIPVRSVTTNVKNFGAKGDGVTNDATAFKNAISATPSGGALLVPKGKYRIHDILYLTKNNITLRGEGDGPDGTVLQFTKPLMDIFGSPSPFYYGQGGLVCVGRTWKAGVRGSQLTSVTAEAVRNATSIRVGTSSGISAGSYIMIRLSETSDKSLGWHLYADQLDPGTGSSSGVEWIVKVKSVSGATVYLHQPLRFDIRLKWSPRVYRVSAGYEIGVENLRIDMPNAYFDRTFCECTYNGLVFYGAINCWAKNLTLTNCDNPGMYMYRAIAGDAVANGKIMFVGK